MITLGLHAYTHDSAAALVRDGSIVAAAEEERFNGRKHTDAFPRGAVEYCLREAGVELREVDEVAIAWRPTLDLPKRIGSLLLHLPRSLRSLRPSADGRIRGSLEIWDSIRRLPSTLVREFGPAPRTRFRWLRHHDCHAASAFLVSPFPSAAILTCDACGEWDTTVSYLGEGTRLRALGAEGMPHSLGLVYAALTQFLGFKVKSDEGKVMALAAFGEPTYRGELERLFSANGGGRLSVHTRYFRFHYDTKDLFYSTRMEELFGPAQTPGAPPSDRDRNLAASLQEATERVLVEKFTALREATGCHDFCLAGGVGLNSKANGLLLEKGIVDRLFVQPAANDAGAALGAALLAYAAAHPGQRPTHAFSPYLGPGTPEGESSAVIERLGLPTRRVGDPADVAAALLARGRIVGWHQGRMEFGPRALGNRSILADPRRPEMKEHLNARVKFREPFRPFGPAILAEAQRDYFRVDHPVPFMTHVLSVRPEMRDRIPATVHHDGTARLQTCSAGDNPLFHSLIRAFERRTGVPVVLNTSLNVAGQPIAARPEDSLRGFAEGGLDYLFVGNRVVFKDEAAGRLVDELAGVAALPAGPVVLRTAGGNGKRVQLRMATEGSPAPVVRSPAPISVAPGAPRKVHISSLGCVENALASARFQKLFELSNWQLVDSAEEADLALVNTCGVSQDRAEDSVRAIDRLRQSLQPRSRLVVTGCLVAIDPERLDLLADTGVDVVSPKDPATLEQMLGTAHRLASVQANELPRQFMRPRLRALDRLAALGQALSRRGLPYPARLERVLNAFEREGWHYVHLGTGCAHACAYCAIRFAKGFIHSVPRAQVVEEVARGVAAGHRRIVLSADDTGSYGIDSDTDLADLLGDLVEIPGDFGLHVRNLEPMGLLRIFERFRPLLASGKIRAITLPMQSGSDRVLEAMGRKYRVGPVMAAVRELKALSPELLILTHVLVGFPGETHQDFRRTLALIRSFPFDGVAPDCFSPRRGTVAAGMPDQVPLAVRRARYFWTVASIVWRVYGRACFDLRRPSAVAARAGS